MAFAHPRGRAGEPAMSENDRRWTADTRLWQVVEELHRSPSGTTLSHLAARLGLRRSTVERDLGTLEALGLRLERELVDGILVTRLEPLACVPAVPTVLELAALLLGRRMLQRIRGANPVQAVDAFLERCGAPPDQSGSAADTQLLDQLRLALRSRRCIQLRHHAERDDAPEQCTIEPLTLRESEKQLYLFGFDLGRDEYRLFKVSQVRQVVFVDQPLRATSDYDVTAVLTQAARVAPAEPTIPVVLRIATDMARLVLEQPLVSHQELEWFADGSLLLRAHVTSLPATVRYVLSFGRAVEVIAPAELRAMVRRELDATLARYVRRVGPHRAARDATSPPPTETLASTPVLAQSSGADRSTR